MVVVWGILPLNMLSLDKDKLCEYVVSIELREKVQNSASLFKVCSTTSPPPPNQPCVSTDEGAGPRLGASMASWLRKSCWVDVTLVGRGDTVRCSMTLGASLLSYLPCTMLEKKTLTNKVRAEHSSCSEE